MIQIGNCLELAKALPDDSVDCIVTSPPYWGLRNYGVDEAWGLEPTFAAYLARVESLFAELLRALKPTGTCWVNMGDSYANIGKGGGSGGCKNYTSVAGGYDRTERRGAFDGLKIKQKDLVGQPWRVAFMLQDQGWYLRQEIIWHKPNAMPDPVKDRCTRAHEQVFQFSKSERYFYDSDAISEKSTSEHDSGNGFNRHERISLDGRGQQSGWTVEGNPTRNCRSVWSINTQAFPDAHFAVFPPELPRRCILAGCPVGGLVLDPFAGSGTTLMVAKQLGRRYLGFEINPEYAAMAERRIANVTPSMFAEAAS